MKTTKTTAFLFWITSIIVFVVVARLLRDFAPEAIRLGIGFLAMWLVGYPTMCHFVGERGRRYSFIQHAAVSLLGAAIGAALFALLDNIAP